MELLGERPVWSMNGSELLSTLDALDAEAARRESYRLHVIAAIEQLGYAAELGARDTAELLRFRYRLDAPVARRTLRLARALPSYSVVSAALDATAMNPTAEAETAADAGGAADAGSAWSLRPAQAEAIVSALERVPSRVPAADRDAAEEQLVKLAAHLSPSELRSAGNRMRDILDTDGPEPEEDKASARESLTIANADRGVKFRGYLANENAELLRALIHAGARPHKTVDGEPDPRSREKRQADALAATLTIAAAAADAGDFPTASPAPHPAAGSNADRPAPSGPTSTASSAPGSSASGSSASGSSAPGSSAPGSSAPGSSAPGSSAPGSSAPGSSAPGSSAPGSSAPGSPAPGSSGAGDVAGGVAGGRAGFVAGFGAKAQLTVTIDFQDLKAAMASGVGQLVYGDGLSAAMVRRLACDAKIIPLVLGANSEPLDVGRCERLVTRAMRRALNTRDKGCVVCGSPPIMCDAHHLMSWIDGGETKTSNLVLLCRRHHVDLHHGRWTITILNGTVQVARPTWADPNPTRNQPQQPPPNPSSTPTPTAEPAVAARPTVPAGRSAPAGRTSPARPAPVPGSAVPVGCAVPARPTPAAAARSTLPAGSAVPASAVGSAVPAGRTAPARPAPDPESAVPARPAPAPGSAVPAGPTPAVGSAANGSGADAEPTRSRIGEPAGQVVVPIGDRSRWKADHATIREAADFATADSSSG